MRSDMILCILGRRTAWANNMCCRQFHGLVACPVLSVAHCAPATPACIHGLEARSKITFKQAEQRSPDALPRHTEYIVSNDNPTSFELVSNKIRKKKMLTWNIEYYSSKHILESPREYKAKGICVAINSSPPKRCGHANSLHSQRKRETVYEYSSHNLE